MKYLAILLAWVFWAFVIFIVSGFLSGSFVIAEMDRDMKVGTVMFGLLAACITSGIIAEQLK